MTAISPAIGHFFNQYLDHFTAKIFKYHWHEPGLLPSSIKYTASSFSIASLVLGRLPDVFSTSLPDRLVHISAGGKPISL
jgi:hypothetical protein